MHVKKHMPREVVDVPRPRFRCRVSTCVITLQGRPCFFCARTGKNMFFLGFSHRKEIVSSWMSKE